MGQVVFQRAFSAGELAPALAARADLARYTMGLRTCRNFLVQRHGGVANRAGFRFVAGTKADSISTFLLRYVSDTAGESILIEAGPNFLRFYKNGAQVTLAGVTAWSAITNYIIGDIAVSGGVNYYCVKAHLNQVPPNATFWYAMPSSILELPTVFGAQGFAWVQNGNTITLTGNLHPPYELVYVSLTRWIIRIVSTAPAIDPPTALIITPGPPGTLSYQYKVTSAAALTYEESIGSAIQQVNTIDKPTTLLPHIISWTPPAQAVAEYYVYLDPYGNGTFGFIGTATGAASFRDTGFVPDFAVTPPLARILFNATGDYPATASHYQQRRFFANSVNEPDAIYGSRTGFPSNFSISSPLQDDDALTFRISGNQHNPVRHLVGLKSLLALTDAGEWTIVGSANKVLSPNTIDAEQETYVGVSSVRPVIVGNSIIYVQARGSIVRDLRFDQDVEGLAGRDVTLFAAHLFDGFTIARLDFQQTPNSTVWAVRSDGTLLGLTYLREEEVSGWHRHDSGASCRFEDVCVVPEIEEDVVYVLVRRTINGGFKRYIERLESRVILNYNADSFFVDSGLSYSGAPVTTMSGLTHLVGQVVAVVADGVVIFDGNPLADALVVQDFTVTAGGAIPHVLTTPASVIHAGIPIRYAEIETLELDVQGSDVRDKRKAVQSLSLLLEGSARTFWTGPTSVRMRQQQLRSYETGQGQAFTGVVEISTSADFNEEGRMLIRQTDPLPLTILGVLPNVLLGG
jgi:hypothetical protein